MLYSMRSWSRIQSCFLTQRRRVLDLTGVDFMAVDGMSALHAINAHLLRGGVQWCVVASPAVTRVLGLCDPEGLIPSARIASLRGAEIA